MQIVEQLCGQSGYHAELIPLSCIVGSSVLRLSHRIWSTRDTVGSLETKSTRRRWIEKCCSVESGIPALGVTSKNSIILFLPGMNLILKTSPVSASVRKQNFASLPSLTSQLKVRSCESCHHNDAALGIIQYQATFPEYPEWSLPLVWIL